MAGSSGAGAAYVYNNTPGDPDNPGGSAASINQKILVELRIISWLLAQSMIGQVTSDDLDNLRADPSSLNQRLS